MHMQRNVQTFPHVRLLMFEKIKDALQVKEEFTALRKDIQMQEEAINKLQETITALSSLMKPLHEDAQAFHTILSKDITVLKDTKEAFTKELFDFSLLKGQLHKKIMEQFDEALAKELLAHKQSLQERQEHIHAIEHEFSKTTSYLAPLETLPKQLQTIEQEITKLSTQSSHFSHEIERVVRQKVYLEQKVNQLEKLCATLRRRTTKP